MTFGLTRVDVHDLAPGVQTMRADQELRAYPVRLTDRLRRWAESVPHRCMMAQRLDSGTALRGDWQYLSYGEAWQKARCIAQGLIDRKLSVERPVVILSENNLEHALLTLGSMLAGVLFAPISLPCSLVSQDFHKLRHVVSTKPRASSLLPTRATRE
jgi:feruloyl-CoA synthase